MFRRKSIQRASGNYHQRIVHHQLYRANDEGFGGKFWGGKGVDDDGTRLHPRPDATRWHTNLRRARSAAENIVPTTTAAIALRSNPCLKD